MNPSHMVLNKQINHVNNYYYSHLIQSITDHEEQILYDEVVVELEDDWMFQ